MKYRQFFSGIRLSHLLCCLLFVNLACDSTADDSIDSRNDLNLDGDWEIVLFLEDGVVDNTDDYQGMVFTFNGSSISVSRAGAELTTGSCDETMIDHDGDGETSFALDMNFAGSDPFPELVEEWVVLSVESDGDLIRLIEGSSQQLPERMDIRRL